MARLSEVKQSADDIGQTAEEALESTREELRKLREKLHRNGAQLEDELRDAGERFAEGARTFGNAAAEQVRAHPLAAFGIAFAAGYILSRALRR